MFDFFCLETMQTLMMQRSGLRCATAPLLGNPKSEAEICEHDSEGQYRVAAYGDMIALGSILQWCGCVVWNMLNVLHSIEMSASSQYHSCLCLFKIAHDSHSSV